MTPIPSDALRGRSVLIAHEDVFKRSYLQDVLAASGATIAGAVGDPAVAATQLDADPPPCAVVLSSLLPDRQAITLTRAAASRGLPILVVEPARAGAPAIVGADAVLTEPYAGFQVVDAIATLLAASKALSSSVAHRRGR